MLMLLCALGCALAQMNMCLLNVNCVLVVKLRNWFDFCGKYSIFTVFAEVFNFIVFLYVSCRSSIMSRTIRSYNQLFITDMPTNISNQIVKQNLHFGVDLLNEKSVQSFWKLYLHFDALNFPKFCPILKRPFWQSTIWKKAWSMYFKDILNFDCYESLTGSNVLINNLFIINFSGYTIIPIPIYLNLHLLSTNQQLKIWWINPG